MKENQQQQIFKEWLNEYRALLFKVIKTHSFNREDLNDLFQEVCLQVYRSIPSFKAECAVSTWIYRVALNTAIKWSSKERKHIKGHQEIDAMANLLVADDYQEDERLAWMYSEIRKLNEIDRSLILLHLDGFSYAEMSEILGISGSNIGVKIHRIKKQLVNNSKYYEYDGI
ncbi:MAG: RNA polymerase sigma factor [Saprospiraceae bacterium]